MAQRENKFSSGKSFIILIGLFFFSFILYQIYAAFSPLTTGTAVYYDSYDGIQTTGTIIRDENVVVSDAVGVKYYIVNDGDKVSKGGVIANIYSTQEQAQVFTDMNALHKQIDSVKEVQSYNNTTAVDLNLLNSKIDSALLSVINSCRNGIYGDTKDYSAELLKLYNRKQIAVGEEQDYSALLATLNSQYAALQASAPAATANITSSQSGYFVSTTDGFESQLVPSNINDLTPEKLTELTPSEAVAGASGKIVSDYTWYIACTLTIKQAAAFKQGDNVKLKTTLKSASELTATVASINLGSGKDAVLVFSCEYMNGDLAAMRTIPVTVVTGEYSGLRVSNKSVRIVDGKTGVYIISGMQAKFVEIEIVHSASGYTLCKIGDNSSGTLRLYDEVIEKGKNLYDGKIIR